MLHYSYQLCASLKEKYSIFSFFQKVDYEILWEAVDGNQTVDRRKLKEKSATGYSLSGGSYPMRGLPPYDSPGNAGYGLSPDSTATFLGTGKSECSIIITTVEPRIKDSLGGGQPL